MISSLVELMAKFPMSGAPSTVRTRIVETDGWQTNFIRRHILIIYADMAELADAHGSGPCESNFMQVQVLLSAPNSRNPNLVPIGEGFGFLLYLDYPNFNSKLEKQ